MTQPEACQQLVEKAIAAFGQIDVLVNNAGISMLTRFDEITDLSIFEQVMQVNYLGAVYCTPLPHGCKPLDSTRSKKEKFVSRCIARDTIRTCSKKSGFIHGVSPLPPIPQDLCLFLTEFLRQTNIGVKPRCLPSSAFIVRLSLIFRR